MIRFPTVAAIALALCISVGAYAQDELPNDAASPKHGAAKAGPQPTPPVIDAAPAGTMIDQPAATLLALDKVTAQADHPVRNADDPGRSLP
jgi:hypothetical protein